MGAHIKRIQTEGWLEMNFTLIQTTDKTALRATRRLNNLLFILKWLFLVNIRAQIKIYIYKFWKTGMRDIKNRRLPHANPHICWGSIGGGVRVGFEFNLVGISLCDDGGLAPVYNTFQDTFFSGKVPLTLSWRVMLNTCETVGLEWVETRTHLLHYQPW